MKTQKIVMALVVLFLIATLFWLNSVYRMHSDVQLLFKKNVTRAVKQFAYLQKSDTLDLVQVVPFPWDTVYVFRGNTSEIELYRELGRIDWSRVMTNNEQVSEDVIRFVFLNKGKAMYFVDVNEVIISSVHLSKYYLDDRGYYQTWYTDSAGVSHNYTTNYFTRSEAKFILVRPGKKPYDAPSPLSYFQHDRGAWSLPLDTDYMMHLHPVSGCGLPGCLANKNAVQ